MKNNNEHTHYVIIKIARSKCATVTDLGARAMLTIPKRQQ